MLNNNSSRMQKKRGGEGGRKGSLTFGKTEVRSVNDGLKERTRPCGLLEREKMGTRHVEEGSEETRGGKARGTIIGPSPPLRDETRTLGLIQEK